MGPPRSRRKRPPKFKRWLVLAVGLLVESICGLFYAFGLYSDDLKARFQLSQVEVSLIGTAALLGGNFGTHMGLIKDRFGPGPVLVLAVLLSLAGWLPMWHALNQTEWQPGFGLLFLFALFQGHAQMTGDLATVPTAAKNFPNHRGLAIGICKSFVGLSGALATQWYSALFKDQDYTKNNLTCAKDPNRSNSSFGASAWMATDDYRTGGEDFGPYGNGRTDGSTGGSTDGGGGGGANLMYGWQHQPYSSSSSSSSSQAWDPAALTGGEGYGLDLLEGAAAATGCQGYIPFLLFLAVQITIIGLVGALVTRELPLPFESDKSTRKARSTLQKIVYIIMMLAALTAAASIVEKYQDTLGKMGRYGLLGAVQGMFFLLLVFTATRRDPQTDLKLRTFSSDDGDGSGALSAPLMGSSINAYEGDGDGGNLNSVLAEIDPELKSFTLWQALKTSKFYLIFFSFFIGGGSGVMVISNLGQIIDGMTGTFQSDVTVFVTIISVCNCWGRLLSGMLGDYLVKRGHPRPIMLSVAMALMVVAQVLMIFGSYNMMYVVCTCLGLSYGAFNALCPTLITEIFGDAHAGSIYATNSLSNGIASILIGSEMAGALYNHEAHTPNPSSGGLPWCDSKTCYRSSAIICAIISACGVGLGLVLSCLTKRRYHAMYDTVITEKQW